MAGTRLGQLTTAIAEVQQATGKPVTTSEPGGQYYSGANSQALLVDWATGSSPTSTISYSRPHYAPADVDQRLVRL